MGGAGSVVEKTFRPFDEVAHTYIFSVAEYGSENESPGRTRRPAWVATRDPISNDQAKRNDFMPRQSSGMRSGS